MRFYSQQKTYYCGIDLHSKRMYVCLQDSEGKIRVHKNIMANPEQFLRVIAPYRENLVVGVECKYSW